MIPEGHGHHGPVGAVGGDDDRLRDLDVVGGVDVAPSAAENPAVADGLDPEEVDEAGVDLGPLQHRSGRQFLGSRPVGVCGLIVLDAGRSRFGACVVELGAGLQPSRLSIGPGGGGRCSGAFRSRGVRVFRVAAFRVGIFWGDNDRARAAAVERVPGHDASNDQHRRDGNAGQRATGGSRAGPGPRPASRSARSAAVPTPPRIALAGPGPPPRPDPDPPRRPAGRSQSGRRAGSRLRAVRPVRGVLGRRSWLDNPSQVGEAPRHQALHRARPHTHRLGGLLLGHLRVEAQHYCCSLFRGQRLEGVDQVVAFCRCFRRADSEPDPSPDLPFS